MRALRRDESSLVSAGFKFHFNIIQVAFTAMGAFIISGPVGAGVVIGAALATQGTGQLVDMYNEEIGG